jgi:hypothetical protein
MVRLIQWCEISVKNSTRSLVFLAAALLGVFTIQTRAQTQDAQKIKVEIQTPRDGGPSFTLTNLSDKALAACEIEIYVSSKRGRPMGQTWDSAFLGTHSLEPGATMTKPLPHVVGDVFPDTVVVTAGIWEDGETFGDTVKLNYILKFRARMESQYKLSISFLQRGLDENWDRATYLEKLSRWSGFGEPAGIRSNLESIPQDQANPKRLQIYIHKLLEILDRRSQQLLQAKPHMDVPMQPLPPET